MKLLYHIQESMNNVSRYNPVYLWKHGAVNHLLNAIGLKLQSNNNVMFISASVYVPFHKIYKKKRYG